MTVQQLSLGAVGFILQFVFALGSSLAAPVTYSCDYKMNDKSVKQTFRFDTSMTETGLGTLTLLQDGYLITNSLIIPTTDMVQRITFKINNKDGAFALQFFLKAKDSPEVEIFSSPGTCNKVS